MEDTIQKLLIATKEDVQQGKIPLSYCGGNRPGIIASWDNGKVRLFDQFFEDHDPLSRKLLLYHEFGHEVTRIAFAKHSEETNRIIALFRESHMMYYNPFGSSPRPDEMIADTYAAAMVSPGQANMFEESGRYEKLTNFVLKIATEAGLPLPTWYSP